MPVGIGILGVLKAPSAPATQLPGLLRTVLIPIGPLESTLPLLTLSPVLVRVNVCNVVMLSVRETFYLLTLPPSVVLIV